MDSVSDSQREIHIDKARQMDSEATVGGLIETEVDPAFLGDVLPHKLLDKLFYKEFANLKKDRIFDDFKDTVGDIVTGTVRRRERGDLLIDLGKAEAILPARERIAGEDYAPGESIRCLLLKILSKVIEVQKLFCLVQILILSDVYLMLRSLKFLTVP